MSYVFILAGFPHFVNNFFHHNMIILWLVLG